MTAEVIAFPGIVRHRQRHLKAARDFLVVIRERDSIGFHRAGRAPAVKTLDDLQAGVRLAREAAERDD
jgi:hypothetical protein